MPTSNPSREDEDQQIKRLALHIAVNYGIPIDAVRFELRALSSRITAQDALEAAETLTPTPPPYMEGLRMKGG